MHKKMKETLEGGDEFSFPMVLVSFKTLRELGRLHTHEHVRTTRANDVVYIDTARQAKEFRKSGNKIVFFSHQCACATTLRAAPLPNPKDTLHCEPSPLK